jgi:hypothetical protein
VRYTKRKNAEKAGKIDINTRRFFACSRASEKMKWLFDLVPTIANRATFRADRADQFSLYATRIAHSIKNCFRVLDLVPAHICARICDSVARAQQREHVTRARSVQHARTFEHAHAELEPIANIVFGF